MYKSATRPDDPIQGVIDALQKAADTYGRSLSAFLADGELLIHGTTRAINAIITGATAKTAFLTTAGHPDILTLREGGRQDVFNFTVPFPEPYVPRSLTWEISERILTDGTVRANLDEMHVLDVISQMKTAGVEAVAVCLLWSIVNSAHEERIGALIEEHLPGVPYTLSHKVNPSLREYRRASSTAIDASLKPLMSAYMGDLSGRLKAAGFSGRVLIVTSGAGVIDAGNAAETPVHLINSGPAMAPVAGRYYANLDVQAETAIVADTGGTTYDLSVVRRGQIPFTRETWIGGAYRGHMTGFPSVDVRSIGAGGGSIAWVDDGGLAKVGPQSAAAVPGPAAYGRGGTQPTLTDACLVLGYLDPDFFLGGSMPLDTDAARKSVEDHLCSPLGLSIEDASLAVVQIATENMVQAIMDITVNQGIDPRKAVLIGGGGAAGLNSERIAARLGCPKVLIPDVGAALSASGALMSDLVSEFRATHFARSDRFDAEGVNAVLGRLAEQCAAFVAGPGAQSQSSTITFSAEARYPHQVWEIDVPLRKSILETEADVRSLVADFHSAHREVFAIDDPNSEIEVVGWKARVSCQLRSDGIASLDEPAEPTAVQMTRPAYFGVDGWVDTPIVRFDTLAVDAPMTGPAIVESSFTTIVVNPGAVMRRLASGSVVIDPAS